LHTLDAQTSPPVQTFPHAPQSFGLFVTSTHAPLQFVRPTPHIDAHIPVEQTPPGGHAMPQPPQFFGSESVSTQTPLQSLPTLHVPPSRIEPSLPPSPTFPSVVPSAPASPLTTSSPPPSTAKYASRSARPQPLARTKKSDERNATRKMLRAIFMTATRTFLFLVRRSMDKKRTGGTSGWTVVGSP
jgi:hypothetical protein